MKKLFNTWSVIYKEIDGEIKCFNYDSNEDAKSAYQMVIDSNGGETFDEKGVYSGCINLEFCYLTPSKFIKSSNT